ncbi:MAG: hypothetical protein K8F56_06575 [Rhodocyclaceae bacterium]|nr:hypothetical protein [Rhodocyclaceae bacterium]
MNGDPVQLRNLNSQEFCRDGYEAVAEFAAQLLVLSPDRYHELGRGDSRNIPDVLAAIGNAWAEASASVADRWDGEYLDALDRYVESLLAAVDELPDWVHPQSFRRLADAAIQATIRLSEHEGGLGCK